MKKILLLISCVVFLVGISSAQTVINSNDSGAGSLRDEINSAASGATITIDPSLAGQTVILTSGVITLGVDVTIVGADGFEVSGNNASRVFMVSAAATVSISNVIISNGAAGGFNSGGAFDNAGTLTLTDCTVGGSVGFNGGAIRNQPGSVLNLTRCTFSGNTTSGNSGGAIVNSGAIVAANCTFSGNAATGSNRVGGAIAHFPAGPPATMTLNNCTLTGNTATGPGGAIYTSGSTVSLSNTIVSGNTASSSPDIFGPVVTLGNNLIEDITGATITGAGTGDITGVSANLGALAANGGLTETHALLVGSPAIDAGSAATAAPLDQRNFGRSGTPDIGAFEFNGTLPVELLSFEGRTSATANELTWITATEEVFSHFEVERSANGMDFRKLDEVRGNGNSAELTEYAYSDNKYLTGYNYYRLKMVDLDGAFEYSNLIELRTASNGNLSVFPNPAKNSIQFQELSEGNANFTIIDMAGNTVMEGNINSVNPGLNINSLTAGLYILQVKGENVNGSVKFIKE